MVHHWRMASKLVQHDGSLKRKCGLQCMMRFGTNRLLRLVNEKCHTVNLFMNLVIFVVQFVINRFETVNVNTIKN